MNPINRYLKPFITSRASLHPQLLVLTLLTFITYLQQALQHKQAQLRFDVDADCKRTTRVSFLLSFAAVGFMLKQTQIAKAAMGSSGASLQGKRDLPWCDCARLLRRRLSGSKEWAKQVCLVLTVQGFSAEG